MRVPGLDFISRTPALKVLKQKTKTLLHFGVISMCHGISETQKTAFSSQLSLSTMWGPGPELWLSGLVARLVAQP